MKDSRFPTFPFPPQAFEKLAFSTHPPLSRLFHFLLGLDQTPENFIFPFHPKKTFFGSHCSPPTLLLLYALTLLQVSLLILTFGSLRVPEVTLRHQSRRETRPAPPRSVNYQTGGFIVLPRRLEPPFCKQFAPQARLVPPETSVPRS